MIEYILIVLAPVFGGVLYGFERVVRARMQNRQGPPVLQPFYDMYKLIDKNSSIVHPMHIVLAILHFITLWAVVALMILGYNFLYVIFLHLLATIFIILAGFSVRSVYSHVGSNRELLAMLAYEPIFILIATGFYMINGSYDISLIRQEDTQILSMILLFAAFLLTVPLKLKKSPFDACEAHQEIVGGVEIEYSGIYFEFLYMAKWIEYVFVYMILLLFAGNNILLGVFLAIAVFLIVNLVDNSTSRVNIVQTIKIIMGIGLTLSCLNILGLSYV
ncbi:NADH-quinone oxidoreductase subunit H [Sulfurimonas sp.]|uniref:NADH-quinone oxidoreductase subunit H n=1 Tax=Sulfurimonas sp. TaxID=2022749 RepID=UPI003564173C